MLIEYLRRLLSKNIVIAFFIIDSLGFLFLGKQLPWFAYPLSLLGGFLVGGYLLFSELNTEINRFHEASPNLSIFFNTNNSNSKSIVVSVYKPSDTPDFEKVISSKREQLLQKWEDYKPPSVSESDNLLLRLSRPDRAVYEASVEAYLQEYRAYLEAVVQVNFADSVLRPFQLLLQNTGIVPAEKVTVKISVPLPELLPSDEDVMWHLFDRSDMPTKPIEPDPSRGSLQNLASSLASIGNIAGLSPYVKLHHDDEISNTHGPDYDYDHLQISYHVNEIIHNLSEGDFEPFLLSFSDIRETIKLRFPVRIHAANLPEPLDDLLEISVHISPDNYNPSGCLTSRQTV